MKTLDVIGMTVAVALGVFAGRVALDSVYALLNIGN